MVIRRLLATIPVLFAVSLIVFDLLELNGEDVRAVSLLDRKARLFRLVAKAKDGIEFNDHLTRRWL